MIDSAYLMKSTSPRAFIQLNHNKGSKSVPLLMKNQLSYTPFILLPQVYIASRTTLSISYYFSKKFRYTIVTVHFLYTFKLLTKWLSQTLQICKRSFFMLKIVAKTSRISLYSSYLHILKNSHEFRRVFIDKLSSIYFFAQLSKPHRFSI